jgi:importin subunit beta-1
MTIESMKHSSEKIALQAVEFWSTVCDEEIDREIEQAEVRIPFPSPTVCLTSPFLQGNSEISLYGFAKAAVPYVVPTVLMLLTKQVSEEEDDDWTVAKAASTCLSLFAQCVEDELLGPNNVVVPFIQQNIVHPDWHFREAAVMAFACIVEGPSEGLVGPLASEGLPYLVKLMSDSSLAVKDTTAWALGRICENVGHVLTADQLPPLVEAVLRALSDPPRVACNASYVCDERAP